MTATNVARGATADAALSRCPGSPVLASTSADGDDQANGGSLTRATAGAANAGAWFPAGSTSLVQNAQPAL